jgi:hypothetical protein
LTTSVDGRGRWGTQADRSGAPDRGQRRPHFGAIWLIAAAITFALALCWIIATPVGAGPDEPAQVVKAAATVRGQLIGDDVPGTSTAMRVMTVPQAYARPTLIGGCFQLQPDKRANCQPQWSGTMQPTRVETYVGRYPPLYYFFVGLPTLVTPSVWGFYAMRAISALICAALIGLAFAVLAVYGRARLLVIGAAICITPIVAFMSATINASSMEMAAGLSMWAAGLVLVLDHVKAPPRAVVGAFVASAATLALSRSISPFWVGCALAVLFLLDPRGIIALLRRPGPGRKGFVAIVAVCAFAGLYALAAKSFAVYPVGVRVPKNATTWHILNLARVRIPGYYRQFIGILGWLDTRLLPITMWTWGVLLVGLVLIGLIAASWRQRLCMALIGIAVVIVPMAISTSHAKVDGIVWQGRYSYPLDVGLLLLAAAATSHGFFARRPVVRALSLAVAVAVAFAQFTAYYQSLRRYVVGAHGPSRFFSNHPGQWQPPLPPYVLIGGTAVVLGVYAGWLVWLSWRSRADTTDVTPDAVTAAVGPPAEVTEVGRQ